MVECLISVFCFPNINRFLAWDDAKWEWRWQLDMKPSCKKEVKSYSIKKWNEGLTECGGQYRMSEAFHLNLRDDELTLAAVKSPLNMFYSRKSSSNRSRNHSHVLWTVPKNWYLVQAYVIILSFICTNRVWSIFVDIIFPRYEWNEFPSWLFAQ